MPLSGKPANTTLRTLTNDGFWPDVAIGDLTEKYRVSAEYADNVLSEGLKDAMVTVNKDLAKAKSMMVDLGHGALDDYCADHSSLIDGEEILHFYYIRAVCCRAKAFLLQQATTLNRKETAENAAKEAPETEAYWQRQAQAAIAMILSAVLPDYDYHDPNDARVTLL